MSSTPPSNLGTALVVHESTVLCDGARPGHDHDAHVVTDGSRLYADPIGHPALDGTFGTPWRNDHGQVFMTCNRPDRLTDEPCHGWYEVDLGVDQWRPATPADLKALAEHGEQIET